MNGQDMRAARLRLQMTQAELSEALDLHANTVARAERAELPIHKTTELAIRYLLIMAKKQKGRKRK